jgi:hypothetical protein
MLRSVNISSQNVFPIVYNEQTNTSAFKGRSNEHNDQCIVQMKMNENVEEHVHLRRHPPEIVSG